MKTILLLSNERESKNNIKLLYNLKQILRVNSKLALRQQLFKLKKIDQ